MTAARSWDRTEAKRAGERGLPGELARDCTRLSCPLDSRQRAWIFAHPARGARLPELDSPTR